uniref:Uncharacterized protein n=1 Tax=Amphimedon queenslandica TaxID=400682 RepID=A0A1X7TMM2_AMPQE
MQLCIGLEPPDDTNHINSLLSSQEKNITVYRREKSQKTEYETIIKLTIFKV